MRTGASNYWKNSTNPVMLTDLRLFVTQVTDKDKSLLYRKTFIEQGFQVLVTRR